MPHMLLAPVVASTLPPYPLPTVTRQIDDVITSSKIDRFDRPRWSDVPSATAPSAAAPSAAAPSASAAAVGGWKSGDVDGWTSVAVPFHAAAELAAVPSSTSPSLTATATATAATVAAVAEGEAAATTTTRPSPNAEPLRVSWVSGAAGHLLTLLVPLTLGVAAFGLVLYRRAAGERQRERARAPAEEECEEVYVRMPDGDGVAAGKPDRQYDRGPWSGLPALAPHHGPRA